MKTLFEKRTLNGYYFLRKSESRDSKVLEVGKKSGSKDQVFYTIIVNKDKITFKSSFLHIFPLNSTAARSNVFIRVPNMPNIEKMPEKMQEYLKSWKESNATTASLVLGSKNRSLNYFGNYGGEGGWTKVVHKEFLTTLSRELKVPIKS